MDELEKLKAENAKLKQEIRFYMVEIDLIFDLSFNVTAHFILGPPIKYFEPFGGPKMIWKTIKHHIHIHK